MRHALLWLVGLAMCALVMAQGTTYSCVATPISLSYSTPGALSLPYPITPGTNCTYVIDVPAGNVFYANISADLFMGGDSLTFYDGPSTASPFLGRLYGQPTGPWKRPLLATGRYVTAVISSDPKRLPGLFPKTNITGLVKWQAGSFSFCSGTQTVNLGAGGSATISEPAAPFYGYGLASYQSGANCSWTITAPAGNYIRATVITAGLQVGDIIYYYDGATAAAPTPLIRGAGYVPPLVGNVPVPFNVLSTGNALTMKLVAQVGSKLDSYGFTATFQVVPTSTFCSPSGSPTPVSLSAGGAPLQLANPSPFPAQDGIYVSPNVTCSWLITAPPGMLVSYNLINASIDWFDTLTGYDGSAMTATPAFSAEGPTFGVTGWSSGQTMLLVFRSGPFSTGALGFVFNATAATAPVSCPAVTYLTGASGSLASATPVDGRFLSHPSGALCTFDITVAGGNIVVLSLTNVAMAAGDVMNIFDLAADNSTQLRASSAVAGWVGTGMTVFSGGNRMRVVYSRGVGTARVMGFSATYTSTSAGTACSGFQDMTSSPTGSLSVPTTLGSFPLASGLNCTWRFHAPTTASLPSFVLGPFGLGSGDSLSFYDTNMHLLATFSGILTLLETVNDTSLVSETDASLNDVFVVLKTAIAVNEPRATGFRMSWGLQSSLIGITAECNEFNLGPPSFPLAANIWSAGLLDMQCDDGLSFPSDQNLGMVFSSAMSSWTSDQSLVVYGAQGNPVLTCPGQCGGQGSSFAQVFMTGGSFTYSASNGYAKQLHPSASLNLTPVNRTAFPRPAFSVVDAYSPTNFSLFTGDYDNRMYRYAPGQTTSMLVTALPPRSFLEADVVGWNVRLVVSYLDIQAGATVTVYDGTSTSAPVLRTFIGGTASYDMSDMFSSGNPLLVVFQGPSSASSSPLGFGFRFDATASPSCLPFTVIDLPKNNANLSPGGMGVPYPIFPLSNLPPVRFIRPNQQCTVVYRAPVGYKVRAIAVSANSRFDDVMSLYDGNSTTAPLLWSGRQDYDESYPAESSGNTLTAHFSGDPSGMGAGYSAGINAAFAMLANVPCSGVQRIFPFDLQTLTMPQVFQQQYQGILNMYDTNPYPSGLDCTYIFRMPPGFPLRLTVTSEIESVDSLTIMDATNRTVFSSGRRETGTSVTAGCGGDISLRFTSGSLAPGVTRPTRGGFTLSVTRVAPGYADDVCRRTPAFQPYRICSGGPLSNNTIDYFTNCSVIISELNLGNINEYNNFKFPALVVHLGFINFVAAAAKSSDFSFPRLVAAQGIFVHSDARSMSLPNLIWADTIEFSGTLMQQVSLPALRTVNAINLETDNSIQTVTAPILSYIGFVDMDQAAELTSIDFRSITLATSVSLTTLNKLTTMNFTAMSYMLGLTITSTSLVEISFPNLFTSLTTYTIASNTVLKTIRFPNLLSVYLSMSLNYFVTTLDLSKVVILELYMQNARIPVLKLPAMEEGVINLIDNAVLTGIDMSSIRVLTDFTLSRSLVSSLVAPNLIYLNSFFAEKNAALSIMSLCNLGVVNSVQVSLCPLLSCQETYNLFSPVNTTYFQMDSYDVASPNCNANIVGTFGCQQNVTRTVACNSVACIQKEIDDSYSNQLSSVFVPAGTYTGCTTPLTTRGKILTVFGAGMGQTIVDCQGSGRALVFDGAEQANTAIRDMTFRNGAASSGGIALVSAASNPLIQSCEFSGGRANISGGGMLVEAGSNPLLQGCSFHDNVAATGAGLAVQGATVRLVDATLWGNTASEEGGSIAFVGALTTIVPTITTATILTSSAPRGGGIYCDGPLVLSHVTLRGNRASQFGGGMAAISTQDLGTWYNITDCLVVGNTAPGGGGLFGFSANFDMRRTVVRDNEAGRNGGGGLSATCSQNYRILCGIIVPCEVYANIDSSEFVNNTATGDGGGLLIRDIYVNLNNASVAANTGRNGGGAYATVSVLESMATSWESNVALDSGGGFYCEPYTGICDAQTSTFTSNTAGVSGGAMYLCTAACPDMTDSGANHSLPLLTLGNVYSNNGVVTGGYGPDEATDPSQLSWLHAPSITAVSGQLVVNSTAALTVLVTDGFNQVVTSSSSVLTLSLDALLLNGASANGQVQLGGTQTVLADRGVAAFDGVTMSVVNTTLLGQSYQLSCRLSELDSVSISGVVKILPCYAGQGRTDPTGVVVCDDCLAGTAGSSDTDYVCTSCLPGSYASTTRSSMCTNCPPQTHAPVAGTVTCLACPAGYSAPAEGSIDCTQDPQSGAITSGLTGNALTGTIVGVILGLLIAICCIALFVYRLARRRTMQKYYLDNDATVRTGTQETPLQKEVKKIILASSTTRIGGGLYSNVYKAKYEAKWIALKVIKGEMATNGTAQQEFRREAVALSRTEERGHPGVVKLMFFCSFNPMCIGVEFCSGGSLKRALANKAFPSVAQKIQLAAEAASAMAVIHSCDIVHLDLKTDNMLLNPDNRLIVADFGIARVLGMGDAYRVPNEYVGGTNSGSVSNLGTFDGSLGSANIQIKQTSEAFDTAFTPQYVDPVRILFDKNNDEAYLLTADVFSYSMVMWAIMMQEEPYVGENPEMLVEKLRANPLLRPRPLEGAPAFYDTLMRRCWHENPAMRPNFVEIFEVLKTNLSSMYGVNLEPGYATPNLGYVGGAGTGSVADSAAAAPNRHGSSSNNGSFNSSVPPSSFVNGAPPLPPNLPPAPSLPSMPPPNLPPAPSLPPPPAAMLNNLPPPPRV